MAKRKRGFFAELQHQNQLAAKRRTQEANAAHRAHVAAMRQAEQARTLQERANAQLARASAAEQHAAQREAQRLHEELRAAEVVAKNAQLAAEYDEIDNLLAATLGIDDFVDLELLRKRAVHPPPPWPAELERPLPPPLPLQAPPEPRYVEPVAAGGLRGVLGSGKQHAEAVSRTKAEFAQQHHLWQQYVAQLPALQMRQVQDHQAAEQRRLAHLDQVKRQFAAECHQRELAMQSENLGLDALIDDLSKGAEAAVQEYVAIVLSNSVYPDSFPVEHDFEFNQALRELTLTAIVIAPQDLPSIKEYRYVRAKNEISATALPQKDLKERYASGVAQVALRTLHEVFESDRAGWIQTISLTVAAESIDTATGLPTVVPLIAVAADRAFMAFNLSNVTPTATLQHLGALISKNPFALVPVDTSKGVRAR